MLERGFVEIRDAVSLDNRGQKIFGVMHRPMGLDRYPAVLFCHGFAGNKIGARRQFVEQAEVLAKNGIASLRIDYRGCGDSEGDPWEMFLQDNISDGLIAMKWLTAQKEVTSQPIGIVGRSMGGPIAIALAGAFESVCSLCLWTPVAGTPRWIDRFQDLHSSYGTGDYALVNNVPMPLRFVKGYFEDFFRIRPVCKLPNLSHVPLLHVHAAKDTVVTGEHVQVYRELRENARAKTLFHELEESDHSLFDPTDFDKLSKWTLRWFRETLFH